MSSRGAILLTADMLRMEFSMGLQLSKLVPNLSFCPDLALT